MGEHKDYSISASVMLWFSALESVGQTSPHLNLQGPFQLASIRERKRGKVCTDTHSDSIKQRQTKSHPSRTRLTRPQRRVRITSVNVDRMKRCSLVSTVLRLLAQMPLQMN